MLFFTRSTLMVLAICDFVLLGRGSSPSPRPPSTPSPAAAAGAAAGAAVAAAAATAAPAAAPAAAAGDGVDGGRGDGDEPLPKRTKSQIAKTIKVERVKKSIEERREPVHDLRRTASLLAKKDLTGSADTQALLEELAAVDQVQKRARNFGEDLVEDLLSLDGLQNLAPEDRTTRKAAIVGIEALLEDVDAAKARLATLQKSLAKKVEAAQKEEEKAAAAAEAEAAKQAKATAGEGAAKPSKAARAAAALDAPPPSKDTWRQVRLPLRFHSREEQDSYVILATVPGLDLNDLKLELNNDQVVLSVSGIRMPGPSEASQMRRKIVARLQRFAQRDPQGLARIGDSGILKLVEDAYIELGQGEYGLFAETFRLPADVDVDGIDASYSGGQLRILLPKRRERAAVPRPLGFGGYGKPHYQSGNGFGDMFRGAYGGLPGFFGDQGQGGSGGEARGPWAGGAPLFGGHDARYRW
mmetsp:Transcript_34192/g.94246  ORF Transcript_34192/g.94246 Transcript_34192/m.94246 type:complete len:469 (-) Transcript_34192:198-1604(-)